MKEYALLKHPLTTQGLRGLFKSNFELTNQAIRLARFYIKSGHEVSLTKLLSELKRNPSDQYIKDLQQMEDDDN